MLLEAHLHLNHIVEIITLNYNSAILPPSSSD